MVAISAMGEGVVGGEAPAPAVRIVDARDRPVGGISVHFVVMEGSGSVANELAPTDADGVATAGTWRLGRSAGWNAVLAWSQGIEQVRFSVFARSGSPAKLQVVDGDNQAGFVGGSVNPAVLIVRDAYDNPVPDVLVTFAGFDPLQPARAISLSTSPIGLAAPVFWKLGSKSGTYSVIASAPGLPSVVARATALDSTDIQVTYDLQTIADRPPANFGVAGSMLYLATTGQFIEETMYAAGSAHSSGHYQLQGASLTLERSWGMTGTIDGDALSMQHVDWDYSIPPFFWRYSKRR
jgi:hypothetical protein